MPQFVVDCLVDPGANDVMIAAGVIGDDGTVIDKKKFENLKRKYQEFDAIHGPPQ